MQVSSAGNHDETPVEPHPERELRHRDAPAAPRKPMTLCWSLVPPRPAHKDMDQWLDLCG